MTPKISDRLIAIGTVNKPHGIKGEMSVTFDSPDIDPGELSCLFIEREGLPVPFFADSIRQRTAQTWLVTLEGVDSEQEARSLNGAAVSALSEEVAPMLAAGDEADDEEGYYANDLVGMRVVADGRDIGTLTAIDDTTVNILMVVSDDQGRERLIPLADEFFREIDPEGRLIALELPEGLLE